MVKNPPSSSGEEGGSIPGLETKIPHALEATKTTHLYYWAPEPQLDRRLGTPAKIPWTATNPIAAE